MTETFFDKVYRTKDPEAVRDVYDDWAAAYDTTLTEARYATPARVAAAAARHLPKDARILDFACGTGLSGAALSAAGFTQIDGYDVSPGMLEVAKTTGLYQSLIHGDPGTALPFAAGAYDAVTACGAVSPGAAPASSLDALIAALAPGAHLLVSLNDHALADADYASRIPAACADGRVAEVEAEHGPHLPDLGLSATVFVLRRL